VDLGERPSLRIERAGGEFSLVLFNNRADSFARCLAEIEIHGLFNTANAAEKVACEKVIVVAVRYEYVLHTSHIESRKGAMVEGVNRKVDGKLSVKQSHRAGSYLLSADFARVAADAAIAKYLG
jgi:hypothetical protein